MHTNVVVQPTEIGGISEQSCLGSCCMLSFGILCLHMKKETYCYWLIFPSTECKKLPLKRVPLTLSYLLISPLVVVFGEIIQWPYGVSWVSHQWQPVTYGTGT